MPSSADRPDVLVDTSIAVPFVLEDHDFHDPVVEAMGGRTLGLAGHAAFETFAVLTRMPSPARRSPASAARLIEWNFPETRWLGSQAAADLAESLGLLGLAGGAVFDALVAAAAREHNLILATRDLRATRTYRAIEARVEFVS